MKLVTYVNFNGDCRQAFEFYREVLGGDIQMFTYGDMPMEGMSEEMKQQVMHAQLQIGDEKLMGSDTPGGDYAPPQSAHVSVHIDSPEEAERIFEALSEGGTVEMPIGQQPWATRFGMAVDRFGIPWMVNCE